MPFCEIVGHEKQLAALRWNLKNNRLHHAYLFLGPEGVGKKTVALSLAKAIHCVEGVHDFCGSCNNCLRVQNRNHPDVRVIAPLERKKDISIDQVRELQRELTLRAFSGGKKIAILDPAILMNFSAQNALLKTLEEPPGDSLLILIATNTGGLLPTLLSRCLRVVFSPVPLPLVLRFLVERKGMEEDRASILAALSMGSPGKAAGAELEEFAARRRSWIQAISCLQPGDFAAALNLAETLSGSREESVIFLEWLAGWFRDMLLCRLTGSTGGMCNPDAVNYLKELAEQHSLERTLFLYSQTIRAAARIRQNVNRRIALENILSQVVRTH